MPLTESSAACKLLGFPALSNDNSPPQLIALSTNYPWYSLNTALQSAAPYKVTKRAKTKHRYKNFTSVSPLLKCLYTLHCTRVHPSPVPSHPLYVEFRDEMGLRMVNGISPSLLQ